jgi:hypothetical protein
VGSILVSLNNETNFECVFEDWRAAVSRDRFADCALITTQDQMHKVPPINRSIINCFFFIESHWLCEAVMSVKNSG